MTNEEIRQKAIECATSQYGVCAKPCSECEYIDYFFNNKVSCSTLYGYENGFADGVEEGKRQASEKQIPKKPLLEGDGYYDGEMVYDGWRCPNCDEYFEIDEEAYKYCPECGQRIDWREGEQT